MSVLFADTDVDTATEDLWASFGSDASVVLWNETVPDDPHCSQQIPCRMWRDGKTWNLAAPVEVHISRWPYTCAHFYLDTGVLAQHQPLHTLVGRFKVGDSITFYPAGSQPTT